MPTYEYKCPKCGHHFEELQSIQADPLTTCPKCQQKSLVRGPGGGIGLQFKGSGFYSTDYGKGTSKEDIPPSCSSGGDCGCKGK